MYSDDKLRQVTHKVHISDYLRKMQDVGIDKESMDQLVLNYLQVEGFEEAAEHMKKEAGIKSKSSEPMGERVNVRKAIQSGEMEDARRRLGEAYPGVAEDTYLDFVLKKQQLIEVIRRGDCEAALDFARDEISTIESLSPESVEELERSLLLTVLPADAQDSDLDDSHRLATASTINSAILKYCNLDPVPQLQQYLRLLKWLQANVKKNISIPSINDCVKPPFGDIIT